MNLKAPTLILIVLNATYGKGGESNATCFPIEEGRECNLLFEWNVNSSNTGFYVENQELYVSCCNQISLHCENKFPTRYISTLLRNSSRLILNINITETNCNHLHSSGKWTLRYNNTEKEFLSCIVNIFSRATEVNCTTLETKEMLNITCFTYRLFPQGKCGFHTNVPEINEMLPTLQVNYSYTKETFPEEKTYFTTTCFILIPLNKFGNGLHKISVSMYPNVTGFDQDIIFGRNTTLEVELDTGRVVLKQCPEIVEEETHVKCICETSNIRNLNISLTWFGDNFLNLTNDTTAILSFNVTRRNEEFVCFGSSLTGSKNYSTVYKPTVIVRPYNVSCTDNQDNDSVMVACKSSRGYPIPKCDFRILKNTDSMVLHNTTDSFNDEYLNNNKLYYRSECVFKIPKSYFQTTFYLLVTMYPNITGSDSDMVYGSNYTHKIELKCITSTADSSFWNPLSFALIGTISFLVIIIVIAVVILRRKGLICASSVRCFEGKCYNSPDESERTSNTIEMESRH
ncbi:unnamed protein product [Lymnaea stagnalis]|uniref:Ig-like domain-containing protein n=1 Tax=Lymnaea stagnalis TaxID=6523 RepID=A0AAV2H1D4_LYMST